MKTTTKISLIHVLFLLALGCIPLLWFKENYIMNGGDINFSLNPLKEFYDRLFAWNPYYNCGTDNCINFGSLPFCLIKVLFYLTTHSIILTQKCVFVFWYLFMAISIFLLAKELFPKNFAIAKIFTTLFYLINLYQFTVWSTVNITAIVSLAVIPILFTLIIKFFKHRKKKYILLFCILSPIWGITSINPPVFILSFTLISIFTFCLFIKYRNTKGSLKLMFVIPAILIAINGYTLIPLLHKNITTKESKETIIDNYNTVRYLATQSRHSSFTNAIRLMANSEFYYDWKEDPYYPAFKHFLRKRNQIIGYLLPFLALLGALFYGRKPYVKFFSSIAIIGIVLSMGIHKPLTDIYLWAFKHVPLFWLYRSPWLKFSILTVLGYAILAGMGCQFLYDYFKRYKIAYLAILSVCGIYLYFMSPFIMGKMFTETKDHTYLKPDKITVPEYIYNFSDWTNNHEGDFNILLLPDEKTNIYKWGYRGITDISEMLIDKGVIHREYGERGMDSPMQAPYEELINALHKGDSNGLTALLSSLRIKYICQRNDFQNDFYDKTDSPELIKLLLKKQTGIKFLQSSGEWDIYEAAQEPSPLIAVLDKKTSQSMPINITKINPAHYGIKVKGLSSASQPVIVLRENYNNNWRAYATKIQGTRCKIQKLNKHFVTDKFANAWELETGGNKDLTITLYYFPQKLFYLGLIITCIVILLVCAFFFYYSRYSPDKYPKIQ